MPQTQKFGQAPRGFFFVRHAIARPCQGIKNVTSSPTELTQAPPHLTSAMPELKSGGRDLKSSGPELKSAPADVS
jgi:hypothetical protein